MQVLFEAVEGFCGGGADVLVVVGRDNTVARHVTYYYRVAAYNVIGTGPLSSELRLAVH